MFSVFSVTIFLRIVNRLLPVNLKKVDIYKIGWANLFILTTQVYKMYTLLFRKSCDIVKQW